MKGGDQPRTVQGGVRGSQMAGLIACNVQLGAEQ